MKRKTLEPGILTTLKWTLALQLLMLVNNQVVPALANPIPGTTPFYRYLPVMILAVILVALLFPAIQRGVKPWHLLVLLFTATAAILASRYFGFGPGDNLSGSLMRSFFVWDQVIFLVIPLALIAWQFSIREVIWFCVFTALFDIAIGFVMMGLPIMAVSRGVPIEGWQTNFNFQVRGSAVALRVPFMAFQIMSAFIRSLVLGILGVVEYRIMTLQRRQRAELVEANEKLTHYALAIEQLTVSRERNRMARELHDTLAHTLSSVAVELEAVKTLVKRKPSEALKLVDQSLGITRSGLNETRKALQDLRALPIDDLGLTLALKTQAQSIAERSGIRLSTRIDRGMDKLPPDMAYCIYRVAQEGLENVARHAGANKASLQLRRSEGHLKLTIQDNGRGFDPHAVDGQERFGLRGMAERAEMLGGKLIVESKPGKGTAIHLELPEAA
ncbi:MAG: sensor histidine kinase [Anaerolineaceae bacterium]|nr:sensor histidine kinase [Anaerolineaceae bacterium]